MEYTVESASVFKQGNGAKGPWTIYKLKLVGDPQEPTGFDVVNPGDKVTVEQVTSTKNGNTYQNLNYKKVDGGQATATSNAAAPAQSAAPAGGGDPRVVKLLVVMAEQIGVDKNQILDILS